MAGTFTEQYTETCPLPECYQVYTTDCFPAWQINGGSYTLFLYDWEDRQLVYNWGPFSTTSSPGSTCCQTSTGNRYDSPLIPGCLGMPMLPTCFGCNDQPGVE